MYRRLQQQFIQTNQGNEILVWKLLWSLKVPPKVRNMLWRAASSCLPTKAQLCNKMIPIDPWCPMCCNQTETIMHSLVFCPFARECWLRCGVSIPIFSSISCVDWLSNNFQDPSVEIRHTIAMVCWSIWTARNALVWKQKREMISHVLYRARHTLYN